ncbi:MAG: lasso peptide biosynthesis B2 protein [Chloroflexi bacterium]|nr:lasso peptide biosynthesis B2 protein [Chloroflexota bacterium]
MSNWLRWFSEAARLLGRPGELLLTLRMLLFALAMPALTRLPLTRWQVVLEPRRTPAPTPERTAATLRALDRALWVGRPLLRPGCLTRGLTSYSFLRSAGLPVSLHFGLGMPLGKFEGHCWLMKDDEPYREPRDPRPVFTTMWTIPAPPAQHSRQDTRRLEPEAGRA